MSFANTFERFGRAFVPKKLRDPLLAYLLKAGYDKVPYTMFGVFFVAEVIFTLIIYIIAIIPRQTGYAPVTTGLLAGLFWLVSLAILSILIMFSIWSYLNLKIYARTKEMEERLPEYLQVVVTNLRSGMPFDKSLWAAIRPEFGVLSREITIVSKKVLTGNDTSDALHEFAMRYDSPILRRSINLVVSEIEAGGEIASVITKVINNLRKTRQLKKEMATSVVSYMIFIAVIVMVLSPILFALANTILKVILTFATQIANSGSGASQSAGAELFRTLEGLARQGEHLTKDFRTFSFMALGVISFFSSMIVSIIEKGDIKGGLKYIPVFMSISMLLFWVFLSILAAVFRGLVV